MFELLMPHPDELIDHDSAHTERMYQLSKERMARMPVHSADEGYDRLVETAPWPGRDLLIEQGGGL